MDYKFYWLYAFKLFNLSDSYREEWPGLLINLFLVKFICVIPETLLNFNEFFQSKLSFIEFDEILELFCGLLLSLLLDDLLYELKWRFLYFGVFLVDCLFDDSLFISITTFFLLVLPLVDP